jgi:tripartite ATP-independent transporter DctM subunit
MFEALVGFVAFLLLAAFRIPLAFAMTIVGFLGFAYKVNLSAAAAMVGQITFETGLSYTLSVIPLFILMGNFVVRANLAAELYHAAYMFLGHRRGGLAMATVVACGVFGAICGSAIATTATFTKVAFGPMRRFGYKNYLSAGVIATGGTLGILIPPSIMFIIYGIMTDTSIGHLFVAGILPGVIATFALCTAVWLIVLRDPDAGPPGESQPWSARLASLSPVWPILLLFVSVIGGIYGGVFTTTEGAGIGAAGAFLIALSRRTITLRVLGEVLIESVRITSMLFMVLIGAFIFSNFINFTSMPADLTAYITRFVDHPLLVIMGICVVYIVLGTAMEELSMVALTVPLFFPVVKSIGYDPIWFGVVVVMICQVGLTTPPIGMNVFVVKNLVPELSLSEAFRGTWPFNFALVAVLVLIIFFPEIALYLTRFMK